MKIAWFLAFAIGALLPTAAYADSPEIDVGTLIDLVSAGEDFAGQELVLSGVVLNQTGSGGSGLVNIGTPATYRAPTHENFVSVYETSATLRKGQTVRLRVLVEESTDQMLGGKTFVIISAVFRECLAC